MMSINLVKDNNMKEIHFYTNLTNVEQTSEWDLDKDAWRSCQDTSIISIDDFIDSERLLGKSLF